ncbi:MAG: hypothetical protein RRY35_04575 [Clostridiales bacterium]
MTITTAALAAITMPPSIPAPKMTFPTAALAAAATAAAAAAAAAAATAAAHDQQTLLAKTLQPAPNNCPTAIPINCMHILFPRLKSILYVTIRICTKPSSFLFERYCVNSF